MKTLSSMLLALAVSCLLPGTPALAGDQDFTLTNSTGVVIDQIFVSPHDSDKWGDDVMGKEVLADGEAVEIKFHRDEEAEEWDLKVVDKDGNVIEWEKLNLPKINKITLDYDDKKPTAVIE